MSDLIGGVFDVIAGVLAWFYSLWPSYGFSIMMLTLTVMVVVTPLTLKGTRSMLQMQLLQPELKRIQGKYGPGERQQMNEELMAFYQEHGINPLGGCLPLLVQLPVFLVLFRVVSGMTRRATDVGTQLGWTVQRDLTTGPFDAETLDQSEHLFDPQYIPDDSQLYEDLTQTNEMVSFGVDLSRRASEVLGEGVLEFLPYLGLILVVLFSSLYQQRQIQGRNTGAQINPQQQAIMKIMPYFLPVFSFTMPAALVVYFVISNLYRIAQQAYITRSLYGHDESPGAKLASRRAKDDDAPSVKTEGKGRPTPKRNEARGGKAAGSARAKSSKSKASSGAQSKGSGGSGKGASKGSGGSGKGASKGSGKSAGTKAAADAKSKGGSKKAKKAPTNTTGAGRTGRAPTRHGGGRTTERGSPQGRKKKGK